MRRRFPILICLGWILLVFGAPPVLSGDNEIIEHDLYSQYDIGNIGGLAYDPGRELIYLAHGSDHRGSFIHTMTLTGEILESWDFPSLYDPNSYPHSIRYYEARDSLFVLALVRVNITPIGYEVHLVEISITDGSVLQDIDLNGYGLGGGLYVDDQGIWVCSFSDDSIVLLSGTGELLENFVVARFLDEYPGPYDITRSFDDGLLLLDHYGSRIMHVNKNGHYLGELSLTVHQPRGLRRRQNQWLGPIYSFFEGWDGRGMTFDIDWDNHRMFVNDDDNLYIMEDFHFRYLPNP